MLKLIFTLVCLAAVAHAQYCPFGSFNQFGAQRTRYCYKPLGTTVFFHEAVERCGKERLSLVTPKTDAGLNDLNILFRAGVQNQAFWVGAHSTPSKPMNFVFQDNLPLYNNVCRITPNQIYFHDSSIQFFFTFKILILILAFLSRRTEKS